MCSYNQINGTFGCENHDTLTRILKQELDFKGFVQSDWGATHSGPISLLAGLDMDMPGGDSLWGSNLVPLIHDGTIPLSRVDDMATRILATWYKLGQDSNFPQLAINSGNPSKAPVVDVVGNHRKTVRAIGAASAILLKNSGGILPLGNPNSLGIIGMDAGPAYYGPAGCSETQCNNGTVATGWGSGGSYFFDPVTPLQGITARAPKSVRISSCLSNDVTAATKVAGSVETAIVFVNADSGEGSDRTTLSLWNGGDDLINAVASINPNTIVVIHTPGAVLMPWINNVRAVINAGLPGEETGNSIADVLFGDVNPSGRLPYTIAKQLSDYPAHVSVTMPVVYNEGLLIGYRWFDAKSIAPLFEFGFGLSYTSFTYSNLAIQVSGQSVTISASITNSGKVIGAEVPQLYIGFPESAQEPLKILRGFDKVTLAPGQTSNVSFRLNVTKELSVWDTPLRTWKVVTGQFYVYVGASSRDIRLNGAFQI